MITSMLLAASLTYTNDIKPIIKQQCGLCHNGMVREMPKLTNYENVYLVRDKIYKKVWTTREMPPMGGTMTLKERKMIKNWIETGADE